MDRSRGRPPPEVDLGVAVVRRLLAAQFPQWTDLPLRHVQSAGWDNEIFRLGGELAVRLPRRAMGAEQVGRLLRWLPAVASNLTLPIPVPLAVGEPDQGYPWPWTVAPWFAGDTAASAPPENLGDAARTLAQFLAELQAVEGEGPRAAIEGFRCVAGTRRCAPPSPLSKR